jgi:von Willebrand factor type A domain
MSPVRLRNSLASLLPLALLAGACGAPADPLTSDFQPVQPAGDAGVPNIGPLTGKDAGVPPAQPPTSSDGGAPTTCEVKTVQTSPSVPDMLIVLDRSGSMNPGRGSATDRWSGSVDAITDVVGRYDDDIRFGLMTFPAVGGDNGCAAGTMNVPVGPGAGGEIASTLGGMDANGSTPTAASLEAARQTLGPVVDQGPDVKVPPKFVLLVTDGDPNCSTPGMTGGGGGIDTQARQDTIAAIAALAGDGIPTYVVGFETAGTSYAGQLDAMAQAGNTGTTSHRSVNSGDDLALALEEVVRAVTSCDFRLDAPVKDASYVAVSVDSRLRALDTAGDGWTLGADKQTVTLTGDACDAIKNGSTLQIEVRCQVVTLN